MKKELSGSLEQTRYIARAFIENLEAAKEGATVIALSGELGSGKTTFVQALAKTLGVTLYVTSPTFVLIKRYDIDHLHFDTLFHIDAYRLSNGDELLALGWHDLITNPKNLVVLEWPEHVANILPQKRQSVSFRGINEHTKEITFKDD